LVGEPFLSNLLDHYIDLEATRRRIEERAASDLATAREALSQAQADLDRSESRLARVQRGWQDGVLDDEDYRQQRAELLDEQTAERAALDRARAHVRAIEERGAAVDAETTLLALDRRTQPG
jgi:multidrug resistance efflux pump